MNLDYAPTAEGATFEKDHWWVRSRFGLVDRVLRRLNPTAALDVLDVGSGTGINLNYLETHGGNRFARLIGVDPNATPARAGRRDIRNDLPSGDPFDLILAMDVLEHVEDPVDLLNHLHGLLKSSGRLLVTVPAFAWLWTTFDQIAHHRKRYSRKELVAELQSAHFVVEECFFLFGTLFPFFVGQRLALKWRPSRDARLFKPVVPWINRLIYRVTALEMRTWMPYNRWFGSSVVAVARRA